MVSPADEITIEVDAVRALENEHTLPIARLYRTALRAYKLHNADITSAISYDDRLQLMALTKQVVHGAYNAENDDDSGFFNFIGNDRRSAWQSLGALSKERAMAQFVTLIDRVCPTLRAMIAEESIECQPPPAVSTTSNGVANGTEHEEKQRLQLQKKQIQDALNTQTIHQFRAYAEQQHPGAPDQQSQLIEQLQEQHYQQYISQVYEQQAANMTAPSNVNADTDDDSERQSEAGEDVPSDPNLPVASMWTRKDIVEFKSQIAKEGAEGCIKVGHGETVTVRVPTHEDGTCLFWEFATDDYDIGFGVYFEWTVAESNTVTVHISESSDEDEDLAAAEGTGGDVESSGRASRPNVDEIIPIYRRDCHEEVYAGSHVYPGRGVYLLKFDNSYSLWRAKQLFYRVYYSK